MLPAKRNVPSMRQNMQMVLAEPRGFCAGVVHAIEFVERALEKFGAPVYVRHEIVHNRHVVEALQPQGARFVDEVEQIPNGAVTVFSAHGVSKAVEDQARSRRLAILDATCPLVSKVHVQARRFVAEGRTLVLVGHARHVEVDGTIDQVSAPVFLVASVGDVETLPISLDTPVAHVTQTTLGVEDTRGTIEAIKRRFSDVVGPETSDICYATQDCLAALRELARQVDVIFVVGASNSSNSNGLVEIARESGVRGDLLADGSDLDPAWVSGARAVGITAGASAPEAQVQDVIAVLLRLGPVEVSTLPGIQEKVEFRLPTEFVGDNRAMSP